MSYGGNLHQRNQGMYSRPGAAYHGHSSNSTVPSPASQQQQYSMSTSRGNFHDHRDPTSGYNGSPLPASPYQGLTEDDVAQVQQQTRNIREDTVKSLENSYRVLLEAHASADRSAVMLDEDEQKTARTEQNLHRGQLLTDTARDKTSTLKKINRSMFAVSISNPLTANKRKKKEKKLQDQAKELALRQAQDEAEERDRIRREEAQSGSTPAQASAAEYSASGPYGANSFSSSSFYPNGLDQRPLTAEQQLYSFENTEEDDRYERQIDYMITECIPGSVSSLREKALAMHAVVKRQNETLDRLRDDTTRLTGEVDHATGELKRVK
ncbi:hypothetical protein BGZ73_006855 [Actinomortierella ambigua]|nr:hypothetical protein BGZ73_006855 [Actinomortierella ambigua]